jgi:hypothetical protein
MASIIWNRDPQEAMNNPYEYNSQMQFHREAITLSDKIGDLLIDKKRYSLEDRSLEKATWMLQTDALFAFRDSIVLLEQKKHKVVGRLFRDMLETIDLIEYFNSTSNKAVTDLQEWYNDVPIMHKSYRDYIKKTFGDSSADKRKSQHRIFSKFTHRTYKVLLYGYMLGRENKIFYDEKSSLPQTIAMYYSLLGEFGLLIVDNLKTFGILNTNEIDNSWNESMEAFQIPRGYMSEEEKKFFGLEDENISPSNIVKG